MCLCVSAYFIDSCIARQSNRECCGFGCFGWMFCPLIRRFISKGTQVKRCKANKNQTITTFCSTSAEHCSIAAMAGRASLNGGQENPCSGLGCVCVCVCVCLCVCICVCVCVCVCGVCVWLCSHMRHEDIVGSALEEIIMCTLLVTYLVLTAHSDTIYFLSNLCSCTSFPPNYSL